MIEWNEIRIKKNVKSRDGKPFGGWKIDRIQQQQQNPLNFIFEFSLSFPHFVFVCLNGSWWCYCVGKDALWIFPRSSFLARYRYLPIFIWRRPNLMWTNMQSVNKNHHRFNGASMAIQLLSHVPLHSANIGIIAL